MGGGKDNLMFEECLECLQLSAKVTKYHLVLQSHMKTCSQPLHEDTFGGHLKVGLAQIAAMEISRGNHRDNKAVIRYLPWLYHPPSAMQQG